MTWNRGSTVSSHRTAKYKKKLGYVTVCFVGDILDLFGSFLYRVLMEHLVDVIDAIHMRGKQLISLWYTHIILGLLCRENKGKSPFEVWGN